MTLVKAVSSPNYLTNLIIGLLSFTALVPIINILVDPTEVFGTDVFPHSFQINDRFRKTEHLLENRDKYSGFLMGSSRMGYIDPSLFSSKLNRGEAYNLNLSSANVWDYLEMTRFLLKEGFDIELLVVQMDITLHYGDRLRYQHHPRFDGTSRTRFFVNNLFSFPYKSLAGKIWFNLIGRDSVQMEWTTGLRSRPWEEASIKRDHEAYLKHEVSFSRKKEPWQRGIREEFKSATDKSVLAVRELLLLGQEYDFSIYVFVTPHNQHYLDDFSWEEFQYFLVSLSEITEFWCFAGYNSITTDDRNFYESSHYRPFVGALVSQRLLQDRNLRTAEDFGVFISPSSLREALDGLRFGFEKKR